MITINTKVQNFTINFQSSIDIMRIALHKLRMYYSWPNITAEEFKYTKISNSITFGIKGDKDDFFWHTIYLPTGAYEIETIIEEFQEEFKKITGTANKNTIRAIETQLKSAIEIQDGKYVLDIANEDDDVYFENEQDDQDEIYLDGDDYNDKFIYGISSSKEIKRMQKIQEHKAKEISKYKVHLSDLSIPDYIPIRVGKCLHEDNYPRSSYVNLCRYEKKNKDVIYHDSKSSAINNLEADIERIKGEEFCIKTNLQKKDKKCKIMTNEQKRQMQIYGPGIIIQHYKKFYVFSCDDDSFVFDSRDYSDGDMITIDDMVEYFKNNINIKHKILINNTTAHNSKWEINTIAGINSINLAGTKTDAQSKSNTLIYGVYHEQSELLSCPAIF
ncbi:hypothetical protein CHS0354_018592 [Potamilus streckersoni]|uniref:Uncharacterized protein n=1 Tax=Potamilus streckersoni TaxID=2493646 RepID=A0AAE0TER3_9BIVA|nr:hypothetical protein CHS0354_018592 [Potamilus streckersoni]